MNHKHFFLCLGLIVISTLASAQKNIAKFFPAAAVPSGGSTNLHNLISGYITPVAEDFGTLGNNGWYSSAGVHKQWGFDITVAANTISINSDAKTFAPPSLTGITYIGGTTPLPTAYGEEGKSPSFTFNSGPNTGITFKGADGGDPGKDLPVGSLAIPTLQFALGVYKGTDVSLRYTPTVTVGSTELSNWGVGLKHDIKQHIPVMRDLPFSLTVFTGYTSLKAVTDLSGLYAGSGQEGVAQTKSFTAQLLVGKDIKVIGVYGGFGYNSASTDFNIDGTYTVDHTDSGAPLVSPVNLSNPYSNSTKKSGVRGTVGLRLKFGPITINGDYTLTSAQSLLTAGFGVSIR